ncbi:PVC-type heme-binding CxxCH protein [Crateriforma conspicua]|nr:PVC-type heme-binding CxxCH protein [Crateriforma conspicua]
MRQNERVVAVGNSLAERMNQYGHFETLLHTRFPDKQIRFRNFGWPADEVGNQQRPSNYTKIDDPLEVFGPQTFLCFFGFNESFAGTDPAAMEAFVADYRDYLKQQTERFSEDDRQPSFILVSPIAFEATGNPLQPDGVQHNRNLAAYTKAIRQLAADDGHGFVDLFTPTLAEFQKEAGAQFTINGVHVNEAGDRLVGRLIDTAIFGDNHPVGIGMSKFEDVRRWVNDKSWYHLQDYRMLNGWYVYGGRRTWDTETFPREYKKIRNIVEVRDQYIWDLAAGRDVPEQPDDSNTGDLFTPETMFGTRDENFRKLREPEVLEYPTPEQSIQMMTVPDGMEVQLFASEREFPELANPNQIAFDNRGRLWVSCMPNYPQWQPGAQRPSDRLLIFEDNDNDGRADKCITFYDKLICPTGFAFYNGGVLVVDEPRILFLKDTDGDDRADLVETVVDGIATDDTHHTVGAWEWSHGGRLHMLEGISLSTTLETPWGAFRNKGTAGCYVLDPHSLSFQHFRTPGYGNPWCLVFDPWGNGMVGDGTNAKQHWTSPLSGYEVNTRRTLEPNFDNEGMRPAVGNEFLLSRHLPDDMQGQFIYACVINMHGMPRFELQNQPDGAGFDGRRVDDLLSSTDIIFRPVDPKIGPDGAVWFGDWCNALIGHMQYSQRDPNRDHKHGRVYRLVNKNKPLLQPITQADKTVDELIQQLSVYEPRTRYRARRELWDRDRTEVLAAVKRHVNATDDPQQWCEGLWLQEAFRAVDTALVDRILACDDYRARAAAIHVLTNERDRQPALIDYLERAMDDPHPRVRLEAVRGLSFIHTMRSLEIALSAAERPMDYWIDYTLEHTLHALQPVWEPAQKRDDFLANSSQTAKDYLVRFQRKTGPGGAAVTPLEIAENEDASEIDRHNAIRTLAGLRGGSSRRGEGVFKQVCSACHMIGDLGKKFGPDLSDIGSRMTKEQLITAIIHPNDTIAKGFETVTVLTLDGVVQTGFVLKETDEVLSLGIADGKQVDILQDDIDFVQPKKASSMPEGLIKTIAPIEFLDLISYLSSQKSIRGTRDRDGWIGLQQKDVQLRSHDGFPEISRDAHIRFGGRFSNSGWNDESYLFLSDVPREAFDFAFHSDHDTDNPDVTIRLAEPSEIRYVWLRNRTGLQERADGLTVWVSDDDKNYRQVWQAEKPQSQWMIELPPDTRGRFIRVGLPEGGTFHLYQGAVYGR